MEPNDHNILPRDGEACYYENFFSLEESMILFQSLMNTIKWEQQQIKIFGKSISMPRLTAWYGEEESIYTYSGLENMPHAWINELLLIKGRIEKISGVTFNSVLLNLYRDGNDSMGWHKDNERALGSNPVIGSVSFGASRKFKFKHDHLKNCKTEIELKNGSFLLMKGETQHHWYHSVPKTKRLVLPRINLTFRVIK